MFNSLLATGLGVPLQYLSENQERAIMQPDSHGRAGQRRGTQDIGVVWRVALRRCVDG